MEAQNNQTAKKERIVLLDALRGYALMGLFIVHMVEYFELYWYKPEPGIWFDISFGLFGGKAYAIFALLFGVSFHIVLQNYKRKGDKPMSRFLRRIAFLLMFGIIHSVFYGGDILQILALSGFFLAVFHSLKNNAMLILSLLFLLQVPMFLEYLLVNGIDTIQYEQPYFYALSAKVHETYAIGSFGDVITVNITSGQLMKWAYTIESGRLDTILGMSMFGVWLSRIEYFTKSDRFAKTYIFVFVISLISSSIFYLGSDAIKDVLGISSWIMEAVFSSIANLSYVVFSVSAVVLLYQIGLFKAILNVFAPIGRMSLTVYMFQSFIFVPLFYGYGLGLYETIGQTVSFWAAVVLWIIQMVLAQVWMKQFYYGPLEWIWRMLTFGDRSIAFRKK